MARKTKGKALMRKGLQQFLSKKGSSFKPKEINFDPQLEEIAKMMGKKIQGKAMGGEVMDTTKSMPVGMMGGGKVKPMKMKMGGVIPGRGGMFKGIK